MEIPLIYGISSCHLNRYTSYSYEIVHLLFTIFCFAFPLKSLMQSAVFIYQHIYKFCRTHPIHSACLFYIFIIYVRKRHIYSSQFHPFSTLSCSYLFSFCYKSLIQHWRYKIFAIYYPVMFFKFSFLISFILYVMCILYIICFLYIRYFLYLVYFICIFYIFSTLILFCFA